MAFFLVNTVLWSFLYLDVCLFADMLGGKSPGLVKSKNWCVFWHQEEGGSNIKGILHCKSQGKLHSSYFHLQGLAIVGHIWGLYVWDFPPHKVEHCSFSKGLVIFIFYFSLNRWLVQPFMYHCLLKVLLLPLFEQCVCCRHRRPSLFLPGTKSVTQRGLWTAEITGVRKIHCTCIPSHPSTCLWGAHKFIIFLRVCFDHSGWLMKCIKHFVDCLGGIVRVCLLFLKVQPSLQALVGWVCLQ